MRYLLFGTGDYYERYKKWFYKEEIVALLDNAKSKQHTYIDGILVLSPEEGLTLDFDKIIILALYKEAMTKQLLELGVKQEDIYHLGDVPMLVKERMSVGKILQYGEIERFFSSAFEGKKKVILISHELTIGGAPLALFQAAKVLKKEGYNVLYASMIDGPLKAMLLEEGIPVVVDERMQIATLCDIEWIQGIDLLLCNTIFMYRILSQRDTKLPTIWWLHDSEFFYDTVDKEILKGIQRQNLKILSVGQVPERNIKKYLTDIEVDDLLYGVEDIISGDTEDKETDNLCFATIGYIEPRKAQDILVSAIMRLGADVLEQCNFLFVGNATSQMAAKLKEICVNIPQIKFIGVVGRDEIHTILSKTDMLICPSREDPMPTVVAEAFMHKHPVILSDATGFVRYVHEGENGILFESENVDELADRIRWCVQHKEMLPKMGEIARGTYENIFSMEAFKKNLIELVEEAIGSSNEDSKGE